MCKESFRIIFGKIQLRKSPRNSSLGLFPNPTELSFPCSFSKRILSIHYVQMRPYLNSLVSSQCTSSVSAHYASCWLSDGNRHKTKVKYSSTPLIRINLDGEPSGNAENPDNWIFFENSLHGLFEVRLLIFRISICIKTFRSCLICSSKSHNTVLYLIR